MILKNICFIFYLIAWLIIIQLLVADKEPLYRMIIGGTLGFLAGYSALKIFKP